jgi:hypothetical protein
MAHDKLESWLHTIILIWSMVLFWSTFSVLSSLLCSIWVVILSIVLLIIEWESKKKIGFRCCWTALGNLFFHYLEIIIMKSWGVMIVVITAWLCAFESHLTFCYSRILHLHAMRLCQLLMLQVVIVFTATFTLDFFFLVSFGNKYQFFLPCFFLPWLLLWLFLLGRVHWKIIAWRLLLGVLCI